MRLNRFLATAGLGSRRSVETLVFNGHISINDRVVTNPGIKVSLSDQVRYKGQLVVVPDDSKIVCIMLNKPVGVVSTMSIGKEKGSCLTDLVNYPSRVFPVGRLDRDSSGLLLLTNDGELAFKLTHPRFRIEKEYLVKVDRPLTDRDYQRIARGVLVDSRKVTVEDMTHAKGGRISIVIHEGRKRIIRRMMGEVGLKVVELKRIRIGSLHLGRLSTGKWRKVKPSEIDKLQIEVDDK